MSTNATLQLPAPYRVLTDEEYDAAYAAAREAAQGSGQTVPYAVLDEMARAMLAAVGVFTPAPEPEPDACTAMYLPHDAEEFGPDLLGQWQQCADEAGHDGRHDNGEVSWRDDLPGALPARTEGEA